MLHDTGTHKNETENQENTEESSESNTFFAEGQSSLLATARVGINIENKRCMFYCLLDSGSQSSFITKYAAKKLKLRTAPTAIEVNTLNGQKTTKIRNKSNISIDPHFTSNESISTPLLIIDQITSSLPTKLIKNHNNWTHINNLQLADPNFFEPTPIDILLGADIYAKILRPGIRKGGEHTPIAINTMLG
jgi:hypothetical protein